MPADVLVGIVRSPELARATLTIGKEEHERRLGDHVVIEFDDGTERRLIVAAPQVLSKFEKRDQWEDLAGQPLAQLFADVAPGDHVKCELEGWRITPGTRIAFIHDGDEIRIIAVAERDDATAIDDVRQILHERAARVAPPPPAPEVPREPPPAKPWRRTVWFYAALGLVGLGTTVATWIDPWTLLEKDHAPAIAMSALVPTVFILELALMLILLRPWFEVTDTHAPRQRFRPAWSKGGGLALGLMFGFVITDICAAMPFVSWKPTVFVPLRLYALGGMSLIVFILVMHGQRLERRFARLLHFGALRGTLVAESPPLVRDVRYDQHSQTTGQGDRKSTTVWYEGVGMKGGVRPFALEINGQRMAVAGGRIFWGAPVEYERLTESDRSKRAVAKTHAQIGPGDSVLVRGKPQLVDGMPTFQATGAESFVMFGAAGNARAALTKLVLRWYAGAALILAISIGSVAYGVHLASMAPPAPKPPVPAERPY